MLIFDEKENLMLRLETKVENQVTGTSLVILLSKVSQFLIIYFDDQLCLGRLSILINNEHVPRIDYC